jgi:hypothetical protein
LPLHGALGAPSGAPFLPEAIHVPDPGARRGQVAQMPMREREIPFDGKSYARQRPMGSSWPVPQARGPNGTSSARRGEGLGFSWR